MNAIDARNRIDTLRAELRQHNIAYYQLDAPQIPDHEYDMLMRELVELEAEYPQFFDPESPSRKVGGSAESTFSPVTHPKPLLSLDNAFSIEEIDQFRQRLAKSGENDPDLFVELKIDGLSVAITFENGVLTKAATRGDGVTGEDVTANILAIKSLPHRINTTAARLTVRGEAYMPKQVFVDLNREREENGESVFASVRAFFPAVWSIKH